jgi:acylphosphatase
MTDTSLNDLTRVHIRVRGRVQGVGFRAFVLQSATMIGLTGWVRNVGYNQVETIAEGPRPILERFLEVVKTGPRASRVDEADVEWETPTGEFHRFDVK